MIVLYEALVMGLLAAVAPSPHNLGLGLMSLRNERSTRLVAFCLGALLLDLGIVAACLFLGGETSFAKSYAPWLRVAGSLFYLLMAYKVLRGPRTVGARASNFLGGGFVEGVLVQSCNPNPFLFWFLVGGPRVTGLFREGRVSSAVGYVCVFLVVAYLGKGILALITRKVSHGRPRILAYSRFVFSPLLAVLALVNLLKLI
jgi:threonine/homoserine/homoserine lactone efflux protein